MNVSDLIQELMQYPGDTRIILQKDSEGNGYKLASGADLAFYTEDGDVYNPSWLADDVCMSEGDWKEFKETNEKVVVIYP